MSMLSEQVNKIRKVAKCIYLATDKEVAGDIASTLKQAADTIEALSEKLQAANMKNDGGWIPCEDRLPEIRKPVLICDAKGNVCIRQIMRIDELGMVWWSQYSTAIAWQPLPEPYHP